MHTEALRLALEALIYHTEMTRPIQKTADAMVELRAALAAPAAVPVALDYMALMDAATLRKLKPGTGACIAFKHGAEWAHARHAAPAAPSVPQWQPIETAPKDMGAYLFLVNGIAVDGFRDATGQMCVRNERHEWRKMRGKPTHWMHRPAAPGAQGDAS